MIRVMKSITAREAWSEHGDVLEEYFWVVGFGKSHTMLEQREMFQVQLFRIILIVPNTCRWTGFTLGVKPRGTLPLQPVEDFAKKFSFSISSTFDVLAEDHDKPILEIRPF